MKIHPNENESKELSCNNPVNEEGQTKASDDKSIRSALLKWIINNDPVTDKRQGIPVWYVQLTK